MRFPTTGLGPLPRVRPTTPGRRCVDTIRPVRTGATILLYHRVGSSPTTRCCCRCRRRTSTSTSPRCEWGRRSRFADVAAAVSGGAPTAEAGGGVTFDDGYADLTTDVAPALERHGVPATAYVTADDAVGRARALVGPDHRAVTVPAELPSELELTVGTTTHRWAVDGQVPAPQWEQHSRPWLLAELQRVLRQRPVRTTTGRGPRIRGVGGPPSDPTSGRPSPRATRHSRRRWARRGGGPPCRTPVSPTSTPASRER